MSMEINGLNTGPAGNSKAKSAGQTNKTEGGSKPDQPSGPSAPSKETVVISAEAKSLSKLSAEVNTEAPVNQSKVDAIKAAIDDGSFKPNAESIASKLIGTDDLF
ncbi:flagellar biosynthesis anti-sigma factor FlgM [Gammaproteobacteria bacterium 42_54_T18]|nr:flagellar biosynthesis anti-sigma factor FlgM [Gammaproteobacteria bacterium 42_54_T18]